MDSGYLWYVRAIPVNIGSPSEVHKSYWLGCKQKCNQSLTDFFFKNVKTAVKQLKKVYSSHSALDGLQTEGPLRQTLCKKQLFSLEGPMRKKKNPSKK